MEADPRADSRPGAATARDHVEIDGVLTVAEAARIARRSVRTIRRAYRSGRLLAYRDGNGRGVRIRYGDLRQWMTAKLASPSPTLTAEPAIERDNRGKRSPACVEQSENLNLLRSTLRRRGGSGRTRAPAP